MSEQQAIEVVKGYQLTELIDTGGFGAVYRAYQPVIEREVAVKVILPQFANEPQFVQRFEVEAQTVARLEHPYIVPLYDFWRDPDGAYLVMRWLRGGSLRHRIDAGAIPSLKLADILDQIVNALHAAHRKGIVHRDIKPENILFDEDDNAYLTDFGIAQAEGWENDGDTVQGSANYIPPEQLRSDPVTPLSDVYSMGIVIYEALTGEHPFAGENITQLIYKQLRDPLPDLPDNQLNIPPHINHVIQTATEKDPQYRYQSIEDLSKAFRRAAGASDDSTIAIVRTDVSNPYKGLRPFDEADANDFFGREKLVLRLQERLAEDVQAANFLALVGPSGSGKSSVVRAGLIPKLRQQTMVADNNWFFTDMIPGNEPIRNLEAALLQVATHPLEGMTQRLKRDTDALQWATDAILAQVNGTDLFLFIDQFEEVFTMGISDATREQFLQLIHKAVTDSNSRLTVVITLRADFFDKPLLYAGIGELIQSRTQVVLPLSDSEIEDAIVKPANRAGLKIGRDLVTAIVADVREEPGALPLLQYALTELYERRVGNHLVLDAYRDMGGVQGALARRAQEVYESLHNTPTLQDVTRQVFLRLVTLGEGAEDTRRRVTREELFDIDHDRDAINAILDLFGQYRLLTFDADMSTREPTVEIAHEALIRHWETLRRWLDASRSDIRTQRQLADMAQQWQSHHNETGYLLTGSRLLQYEEWSQDSTVALTQVENRFLEESVNERQRREAEEAKRRAYQERLERRSRIALIAMTVVFAIAGVISALLALNSIRQGNLAEEQRDRALVAEEIAITSEARALEQLELAQERAEEIQNLNLLNIAEQALETGDSGLAMQLLLRLAQSDMLSREVQSRIYDIAYGSLLREQNRVHERKVTTVAISPDGLKMVTGAEDTRVIVQDLSVGEILWQAQEHIAPVTSVVFSPDGRWILSGATDGTVILWDAESGEVLQRLQGHFGAVTDLAFNPFNSVQAASSSSDETVIVWGLATGRIQNQLRGHDGAVRSLAFLPDGETLISGARDGLLLQWDVLTGDIIQRFEGHDNFIETLTINPDGTEVVSGSGDRNIILWDISTGNIIRRFEGHADVVTSIAMSPTQSRMVSTSCAKRDTDRSCIQGDVIVWDMISGGIVNELVGHTDTVNAAAYSPTGDKIYTASCAERRQAACIQGEVRIWDSETIGDQVLRFDKHNSPVIAVAFHPDGDLVASAGGSRIRTVRGDVAIRIWSPDNLRTRFLLQGHRADVTDVAYSPNGRYLVSTSRDATVRVWDTFSGRTFRRFREHNSPTHAALFLNDNQHVLSAGEERVLLWDITTGEIEREFGNLGNQIFPLSLALNPNQTLIAAGLNNGAIVLWDIASGNVVREIIGQTDGVTSVQFSEDGQRILTASLDRTIRIWDRHTGEELLRLDGYRQATTAAVFNRDETQIIATAGDGTVRLWDIATREEVHRFEGHTSEVLDIAITRNGNRIVTASADGTVRMWRASIDSLLNWIDENRFVRPLTDDEREQFRIADRD